jgi:hypothetical protein
VVKARNTQRPTGRFAFHPSHEYKL